MRLCVACMIHFATLNGILGDPNTTLMVLCFKVSKSLIKVIFRNLRPGLYKILQQF